MRVLDIFQKIPSTMFWGFFFFPFPPQNGKKSPEKKSLEDPSSQFLNSFDSSSSGLSE
jgi:hypothetical protein